MIKWRVRVCWLWLKFFDKSNSINTQYKKQKNLKKLYFHNISSKLINKYLVKNGQEKIKGHQTKLTYQTFQQP